MMPKMETNWVQTYCNQMQFFGEVDNYDEFIHHDSVYTGDRIRLTLKVNPEQDFITAMAHKSYSDSVVYAACEHLIHQLIGQPCIEGVAIIHRELKQLRAHTPANKHHYLDFIEQSFHKLLNAHYLNSQKLA